MSGEFPRGMCVLFEDFLWDNVTNLTETALSSASQDVTSKHGGWNVQTLAGDDGDCLIIAGEVAWEVDEGHPLIFEVRQYVTDADKASIFAGMTDANTESAMIYEDEDGTILSTATDVFGFMLEGEQDTTWQAVATDTDVDKTQDTLDNGADAADSVVQTLRLEANPNDSGTVHYVIDGELVETQTSWFDSSIVYCPAYASDDRATAYYAYLDYMYCSAPRS